MGDVTEKWRHVMFPVFLYESFKIPCITCRQVNVVLNCSKTNHTVFTNQIPRQNGRHFLLVYLKTTKLIV